MKRVFGFITALAVGIGLMGGLPSGADDIVNNKSVLATNGVWRDGYIGYNDNEYEYDYYPIYTSTTGKLTITMQSFGDLNFKVLNSDYEEISNYSIRGSSGSPETNLFSEWLEKGTYYVRVSEYVIWRDQDKKGSYRVKASFTSAKSNEKEPNDNYLQAQSVSNGSTIAGTITKHKDGEYDEYDYYKFTLSKRTNYSFYITPQDDSVHFTLYDNNLNALNYEGYYDCYSNETRKNTCLLNAGTYYVRISKGYGNGSNRYILKFNPPASTSGAKPARVASVSLKKGGRRTAKVTWQKTSGAKGYQVKYAANKKFKKAKKKLTKKTEITLKNLKKKKYFVKVRAYKKANGKKVYGKWSKTLKLVR